MRILKIGHLAIRGFAALAPMAGVADRALRELCIEHGAAFTVGELVSSKGICLGDAKSAELLRCFDAERPFACQLFGSDPEIMAEAARRALRFEPDFIDINMGCPAPKVASNGGGSALMKDPRLAGQIVRAVVDAVDRPVTVKLRAGWDANNKNAVQVALHCEAAGAAAITVHGRTRDQMYAPPVDLSIIRDVKAAVKVPVIGNGDIVDGPSAKRMYEETGCDFAMVGRAATGAPWIFKQINAYLQTGEILPEPPLETRMELLLTQVRRMLRYKDPHNAILEARKHAAYYMRGLRGAAQLRRKCGAISSMEDVEAICAAALQANGPS